MWAILEVKNISKSYGNFSVQDISFDLDKGSIGGASRTQRGREEHCNPQHHGPVEALAQS